MTNRMLYRRGRPIRLPNTVEGVAVLLLEAAKRVHDRQHRPTVKTVKYPGGYDHPVYEELPAGPIEECASDWCREAVAANDLAYRCPDDWHGRYHGQGADRPGGICPTCSQDWLAYASR